ncbi:MAG: hypothetical protein HZA89_04330 [Verrucomicrobia bacterium]|nr:hypothetical protein [Verrucomicrobiota bacterium]
MSVEQRDVIDFCSIRPDGRAALTISDHLPWLADSNHLVILQDKLNAYLTVVESGQIFDAYPQARGREIEIQILCKYPPLPEALQFLDRAGQTIRSAGLHFSWRVLGSESGAVV